MSSNRGQRDKSLRLTHQFTRLVPKTSVIYLWPLERISWVLCREGCRQSLLPFIIPLQMGIEQADATSLDMLPCACPQIQMQRERSFLALCGTFCFHHKAKCRHFEIIVKTSTCQPRQEKPARPGRQEDKHPWLRLPDGKRFTAATAETICYGEDKQEAPFKASGHVEGARSSPGQERCPDAMPAGCR